MKIYVAYLVGLLGFCLVQSGCSNANSGNSVFVNKEISLANSSAPNRVSVQNPNVTNNGHSEGEVKTAPGKETTVQNSSRKFGQDAIVELPKVKSKAGSQIILPLKVKGLAGKDVISYEFDLKFDPAVIQPVETGADLKGTVSQALSLVTNPAKPGVLRIVVYGATAIEKDGVLLNLKFKAVGAVGAVSPLSIDRLMFNEGDPGASANSGQITLF